MYKEEALKFLESYIESESVKSFLDEYYESIKIKERYVNKLANLTIEQRSKFIQKCIDKYESDEYYIKEYKLGYQPRTPLYDVILEYAEKYGKSLKSECNEDFLAEKYQFDNWIVELYIGQGSFIKVYNKENNK